MAFEFGTPVLILLLVVLITLQPSAQSAPQVPCLFIFGDSLVDGGNNNDLNTMAKVNYLPYGIDFPAGPSGRFTNGQTTADVVAKLLGFDTYIPAFTMAKDNEIVQGVNYASGSAGIRAETGSQAGERIYLDKQLANHNTTVSRIAQLLGADAKEHLSKCMYYLVIGSNDYINNYFKPEYYNTSKIYKPEQYADALIQEYSQQLSTLYNMGARRILVSGLGAIGCSPDQLARGTDGSACVKSANNDAQLFDDRLKTLIQDLNNRFPDAKFMVTGAWVLTPPDLFACGVKILSQPCCKVSNTTGLCISGQAACESRGTYAYFDNFHPTEAVNKFVATTVYNDMRQLI